MAAPHSRRYVAPQACLERRVCGYIGVVRVVSRNRLAGGRGRIPLPASGNHCQSLPVCVPYLACEKLASLARFVPSFATQPIIGIVTGASGTAGFTVGNQCVRHFARDGAGIADALEIPVRGAVVGVELPVVTAGVLAAQTIHRYVELRQSGGIAVSHAVNIRIDRMAIRGRVNANVDRWILGRQGPSRR